MADLEDVVFVDGTKARVSAKWRERWPEDFPAAPVEKNAAPAATDSPTGDKKKEK